MADQNEDLEPKENPNEVQRQRSRGPNMEEQKPRMQKAKPKVGDPDPKMLGSNLDYTQEGKDELDSSYKPYRDRQSQDICICALHSGFLLALVHMVQCDRAHIPFCVCMYKYCIG